jgi:hypothetical protein
VTTQAQKAQGFTIQWGASTVHEVLNFDLPTDVSELDVTNHESGGFREFIGGLIDPGTVTFPVNYNETDHGAFLDAQGDSSLVDTLTITPPDSSTSWTVDAWVKGYTVHAPVDGAWTCDITFRLTGLLQHGAS